MEPAHAASELRFNVDGKLMLIAGAAAGTGRAFAQLAARDGAEVALLDLNADGLQETESSLAGDGRKIGVSVDLTDLAAVEDAVDECRSELGGFDGICNVAGWG